MMYEELVESLRICGHWKDDIRFPGKDSCNGCMYHDAENNVCKSWIPNDNREERIMLDAADAIENTSKAYQMLAEAYEAQVTKQEWIPVTERLPEHLTSVIVHRKDGGIFVWEYFNTSPTDECWIDDSMNIYSFYDVTHWQPLPEPPKEETE